MAREREEQKDDLQGDNGTPLEETDEKQGAPYWRLIYFGALNFWIVVAILVIAFYTGYIRADYGKNLLTVANKKGKVMLPGDFGEYQDLLRTKMVYEQKRAEATKLLSAELMAERQKKYKIERGLLSETLAWGNSHLQRLRLVQKEFQSRSANAATQEKDFVRKRRDFLNAKSSMKGLEQRLQTLKGLEPQVAARELVRGVMPNKPYSELLSDQNAKDAADIFVRLPARQQAAIKMELKTVYPDFYLAIDRLMMQGDLDGVGQTR